MLNGEYITEVTEDYFSFHRYHLSVEVHCWTSQTDKVKMYGWSVKVFYTNALFIYFHLKITCIIQGFLQLVKYSFSRQIVQCH